MQGKRDVKHIREVMKFQMCIQCRNNIPFIALSNSGYKAALCNMRMLSCRNGRLWTPLDLAADKGHAEVISLLIKAKACVQAEDKSGVSEWVACTITYVHLCLM